MHLHASLSCAGWQQAQLQGRKYLQASVQALLSVLGSQTDPDQHCNVLPIVQGHHQMRLGSRVFRAARRCAGWREGDRRERCLHGEGHGRGACFGAGVHGGGRGSTGVQAPELLEDLFRRGTELLIRHLPSVFDGRAQQQATPQVSLL